MRFKQVFALLASCVWLGLNSGALAQRPETDLGSLRVTVTDPRGAVILGARVTVTARSTGKGQTAVTDERGEAIFQRLGADVYAIHVEADGFKPNDAEKLSIKSGARHLEARLEVAGANEKVEIKRDVRESLTDPRGNAFTTILTQSQIDQMPDDPDEFEQMLQNMAGPGGMIRVDGFMGGKLPPKSQIREIRIRQNPYAAENHFAGFIIIDVYTKPGMGLWHGTMGFGFRNEATMARNAFATFKGPQQYRRVTLDADGPLFHDKTSMALSAQGMTFYDSKTVVAALPQGEVRTLVQPLTKTLYLSTRLQQWISKTHTLRAEYQRNSLLRGDLGVGNFDLPERAFSTDSVEHILRLSDTGLLTSRFVNEFRLQETFQKTESSSATQAPSVIVSGAFSSGGAGVQASRHTSDLEVGDNVDFVAGRHALRAGLLMDVYSYHTRDLQNTLGSFLFPSLNAFIQGRPSTFSERAGAPDVQFNQVDLGWYLQDDIRLRKNYSLSVGLRHEFQTNAGSYSNFAPRLAFAWSPIQTTVIRAGAGIFYTWLGADTFEQAVRDDGMHMHDVLVLQPGFPNPFAGGLIDPLPPGRTLFDPRLRLPYVEQASLGIQQQMRFGLKLSVNYHFARTVHMLRGHNINAPLPDGTVLDPVAGIVNQIESTGNSTLHLVTVSAVQFSRRYAIVASYSWSKATADNDGPFSLPTNNFNLEADRGPASTDIRHRFYCNLTLNMPRGLAIGNFFRANSAPPYNITTGFDNNHDFVFNDRPAGVERNSARGAGQWELGTRLSWNFGFGKPRSSTTRSMGGQTVKSGGGGSGGVSGGVEGGKKLNFQMYVQAYNVLNHTNLTNFVGVQTSPFFGQPTAAQAGRRVETGLRFSF
jgi:hypothetical protein